MLANFCLLHQTSSCVMAGSADNESVATGYIPEIRIEFLARHEIFLGGE